MTLEAREPSSSRIVVGKVAATRVSTPYARSQSERQHSFDVRLRCCSSKVANAGSYEPSACSHASSSRWIAGCEARNSAAHGNTASTTN